MKRKNRLRGRKAYKTALLNKALKNNLEESNSKSSERLQVKVENFCLSSDEFGQLKSYQNEYSHFAASLGMCSSKYDSTSLLSSNSCIQEECVAPQIKTENGYTIEAEDADEETQEAYDVETLDRELKDPLSFMSIKLEPTDELLSIENSMQCDTIDTTYDTSAVNEKMFVTELPNLDNSAAEVTVMHNKDGRMKVKPFDEIPVVTALEKQEIDPEVSSAVSESNSEPSTNLPSLNSVYHIIKDTDSSLTCKFVKSEILKEDVKYICENVSKGEKTKLLKKNATNHIKHEESNNLDVRVFVRNMRIDKLSWTVS